MESQTVCIGQRLMVVPVLADDRRRWRADCAVLPAGWSCRLVHRSSAHLLPNAPLLGWVLDVDPNTRRVDVSDCNFGFLPISDRMRPRYVASLRHVARALRDQSVDNARAEHFSEVKGMFSRCARRDQWDWRAVHVALGEPARATARRVATSLGEVAAAVRSGRMNALAAPLEVLRREDLAELLDQAAHVIFSSAPRIANARLVGEPQRRGSRSDTQGERRAVLARYSKEKLDRANAAHTQLLTVLTDYLGSKGHRVEANQFVDAFTRLKSGPAIFEAKSVTDDNELAQVRQGLSQLYEYRFRHGLKEASLWLVLSREPKDPWLLEYLEHDREVRVLWVKDGQLSGGSLERLLQSGSAALRREQEVS